MQGFTVKDKTVEPIITTNPTSGVVVTETPVVSGDPVTEEPATEAPGNRNTNYKTYT